MKVFTYTCLALAALASTGTAGATVLYSNLANPNPSGFAAVSISNYAADSFTTDNNNYLLSDVIVPLKAIPSGGQVSVDLFTNNGGTPGTNLKTLGTIFDSSLSTSTFTQETVGGGNFQLTPNTTYFIVLVGINVTQNDADWEMATTNTATGITGNIAPKFGTTADFGQSWSLQTASPNAFPFVMQVDVANATPEPGTIFGALAGLAVILGMRRRRSPKQGLSY